MNQAANPAPAGQPPQQQQQRPSIMKMILIYMVINQVINYFFKGNSAPPAGPTGAPMSASRNVFEDGEPLEFKMYLSESRESNAKDKLVWHEKGLKYNFDKENYREKTLEFNVEDLLGNTSDPTLYAHFYLQSVRPHSSYNYSDFEPFLKQNRTIDLIDWRAKDKNLDQKNLLFKEENNKNSTTAKVVKKDEEFPHIKTRIWVQLVHDTNTYIPNQIPPQMSPHFVNTENGVPIYEPIVDVSQFWLRKKDYKLLDATAENKTVSTTFTFNTYWVYKYMMESQAKQTNGMYDEWGMGDNMDEVKEMILDSNPILVGTTMVVSMLHSLFEFLAIKNEISFWKNIESHKGLSLRTLWVSLFTEVIVLLYLFDNETSFIILFSSFAGLGVTIWKIYKTTKFNVRPDGKFPYISLDYQDAYKSTTMEYDQVASKYLGWILVPLLVGYTIYSLLYEEHKGWYSFVVKTLVGFIYVFGFIEMTPQLYINYKLKSVEHLPWRVMIYKFLNTIVDDFFAFVITMPWLKRLSCFRDDIIFVIYLYQRYIYRVDKNRDPYGKPIPKEELDAQRKLEEAEKAEKKKATQKQITASEDNKPTTTETPVATEETSTVTHRKTQETEEQNIAPEAEEKSSQPATQKAGKMKKKKVE